MDGLDKEIEKLDIKISEIQHSVGCVKELLANSKMVEKSITGGVVLIEDIVR